MNHNTGATSDQSEPRRSLRADFTVRTMRHAAIAKRRATTTQHFRAFTKEPFSMKSLSFLRTAPGAALAVAILATTSVGAYALTNWFNADVTVKQNATVLSADLSQCQGNLPAGVESNVDRSNVQFKILGNPHISAQDLQQALLGQCEASSVTEFYARLFPQAGLSSTGHPATFTTESRKYTLLPGLVTAIDAHTVTIRSTGAKAASFATRAFNLASDSTVYNAGNRIALSDLQPGDSIMFLAYAANASDAAPEGTSLLDDASLQIMSIFKTQYNDGAASNFDYQANNIMPLGATN
ncbi:MAG TPA: hypothetical protein VLI54_03990 [Bacillota bacterium]|nr:hypothetical protein [Bacillota bacterium]